MKIFSLVLCLFVTQALAEPLTKPQARLALGFYFPSLSSVSNKTDIQVALNYWLKELTHRIGLDNVYSVLYDDITEMSTDFRTGKLDMVTAPPLLLANHFDRALLNDGFIGVQQLNKPDQLLIIAQQSEQSSASYIGKRLLLPSHDVFAEMFLDAEVINLHHSPPQKVFSSIRKVNKNQRIILDLFFDKADVAVVYESALGIMVEMNPQIEKKIIVIKKFPIRSRNYAYFHQGYKYRSKLTREAQRFSSESRGQQILEVFHSTEVEENTVGDLERFDTFYQTYLKLKVAFNDE